MSWWSDQRKAWSHHYCQESHCHQVGGCCHSDTCFPGIKLVPDWNNCHLESVSQHIERVVGGDRVGILWDIRTDKRFHVDDYRDWWCCWPGPVEGGVMMIIIGFLLVPGDDVVVQLTSSF